MVNLMQKLAVLALVLASTTQAERLGSGPTPGSTTVSPTASPRSPVCAARVSKRDLEAGVDVVTDVACQLGDKGCVDTACRACKHWDSEWSRGLPSCTAFMTAEPNTVKAIRLAVSTHGDATVGLKSIESDSATIWQYGIGGALFAAAAVAAMVFAAKSVAASNSARNAPETVSPSGSLVYRRASVFQI